ncbi:MAG: hypothetical protein NC241_03050 [Bacteroides sp.]|nr:hypothetical protein [Bacteroides sp.]MCM1456369.1 hypothetical protein [Lachnoclostridium sp.]
MNKTVKIIIYVVGFFVLMGVVDMCSSCGKKSEKSRDEIINEAIAANNFRTCDSVLIVIKDNCDMARDLDYFYWPRVEKVLKAQADYLIETDDPEAEKLFIKILNDNNLIFSRYKFEEGDKDWDNDNEYGAKALKIYNNFCLVTVNQCLINDKPELARKVAKLIRQDMEEDSERIYHFLDKSKDEAKKAIADYDAEH